MSEDDAFKFAQESGLLWYQLIEFEDDQPIYILWSVEEQDYLKGEYNNTFDSQDENFADLDSDCFDGLFEDYFEQNIFNENLDDLSESPELLKNLLPSIAAVTYDSDENSITEIDWDDLTFVQLKSINALLKQPIFEIRQVTLEQLHKITNGEEDE